MLWTSRDAALNADNSNTSSRISNRPNSQFHCQIPISCWKLDISNTSISSDMFNSGTYSSYSEMVTWPFSHTSQVTSSSTVSRTYLSDLLISTKLSLRWSHTVILQTVQCIIGFVCSDRHMMSSTYARGYS